MSLLHTPSHFPDPRAAYDQGLIAVGGELNTEILLDAYRHGIFPWPHSEEWPLLWFCPEIRGIFEKADFHIPKSLIKWAKKHKPEVRYNTCFAQVIRACKDQLRYESNSRGEKMLTTSSWITEEIVSAYVDLFQKGHAYSIEVFLQNELCGGLYGVHSDLYSTAESMFFKESNCSKWALAHLFEYLQSRQQDWVDIQMITPTTQAFGGKNITKLDFLKRL